QSLTALRERHGHAVQARDAGNWMVLDRRYAPRWQLREEAPMNPVGGSSASRGTLLLADVSGYTAFLQAVGVAHDAEMLETGVIPDAYPLMTGLLDGIVQWLVPPFSLSKTEGDAVFAFAADGDLGLRGEAILD